VSDVKLSVYKNNITNNDHSVFSGDEEEMSLKKELPSKREFYKEAKVFPFNE
jgi:hypothetical protein